MKRSLFWLLDHYPETGESAASVHEVALEHAAEADRLGFVSLWVAEHHFVRLSTAPNPAVILAAIAQRTERLRLGPATAVLPLRHPIHVAEDYALVDVLSRGRLNLGVGSGSQATEYSPFGVDFDSRRDIAAKNLACVRERWTAARREDVGPRSLNIAPIQSSGPPIYQATMNERNAHQIGLVGDSLLTLVAPSADGLETPLACLHAHRKGIEQRDPRDRGAESVVMMFAHVAETAEDVKATVVPALTRLMGAMTGTELLEPEALYQQMRRSGTGLFGTPEEVDRQLRRLAELGFEHLAFVSRFGGMPKDVSLQSLRHLAPGEHVRRGSRSQGSHGRSSDQLSTDGLRSA